MTKFFVGQKVEKYTGDYQLEGEIRAIFTTLAGKSRFVVEHKPGFLHIYGPDNIRPVEQYYGGYTLEEMKDWKMMPSNSATTVHALIAALEEEWGK